MKSNQPNKYHSDRRHIYRYGLKLFLFSLLLTGYTFSSSAVAAIACSVTLEQAQEAVGGQAWEGFAASQLSGTLEMPGLSGTFSSLIDLRNGRYIDHQKLGPFDQAMGYDGHVRWTEETPGDVRDEDNPIVRMDTLSERFDRALAYWFPRRLAGTVRCDRDVEEAGIHYAIYTVAPKNGHAFELWINTQTRRIERKLQRQGPVETVTRYADFRTVDGVQAPYLIETESSDTKTVTRFRVEQRNFKTSIDDKNFIKPSLHLDDYTFPSGQTSVTVKLAFTDSNDLYVPVRFNGHGPYNVILDTGGNTDISPTLAREFGIHGEGDLSVGGFGDGTAALNLGHLDTVEIGGMTLHNQPCYVVDLDSPSQSAPLVGLVGYAVFKRLVVRIDNDQGTLTLTEPKNFHYVGNGTIIPFTFRDSHPYVSASIEGIPGQFVVDTGLRGELQLNAPFADAHGFRNRYEKSVETIVGWGVGGPLRGQMTRGNQLRIGKITVNDPLIRMPRNIKGSSADPEEAGTIGMVLLKRYNVIFDYSRQQIIFEARKTPNTENDYDRSGMWLLRTADGWAVGDIAPGGPADQAGARAGDSLLQIAHRAAKDWTLPELRRFLRVQPVETQVSLEIMRDGKTQQLNIHLRDLVPLPKRRH